MSNVLAVTWVARPGQADRVADILRALAPLARTEPGCLHFNPNQAQDDPHRFFLYEEYADEAAIKAHTETDHFKRLVLGQAAPLLESRERLYYTPL